MYIYEALFHVTPHSVCRTLISATQGMRGDQNLGAIISHPSCCVEVVNVDYSVSTPTTDVRSNTAALPLMPEPKTR